MIEINNLSRSKIPIKKVKTVTEDFLLKYRLKNKNVSIVFIGDVKMRRLNKKYRKIDKTTDILSFEGLDDDLGELVINYKQIKRQYKKFSKTVNEELIFILVHGLFHLLGYKDNTEEEKRKMEELGNNFLDQLYHSHVPLFVAGGSRSE